ncbi:translocon-associated protein, delta subunit [Culex quinquefasciatus]|uniref:Translocon-associated protein subunit delta n=1 Tax=Culex quinquefasciatus TaxID=7176 RepID=B0W4D9_CULQU|nr:translocon-associated protein, delta subunit [Culex quinquefasciatus]EDS33225.1 translocon-associated protein, delta subunit [Culex quinquefasciatus]|eukprot:XP_001843581.1 translocon-associated protein, delta subunit [Culex quinquefasciatus]
MNPKAVLAVVALVAVAASVCAASSCSNPVVKSSFFSTSDATIVSQIAFVTEFTLKCSNAGAEKLPLFAEIGGKLAPVVRVGDSKYQVSWNEEIKKASSGKYTIRLFDEESFAAVRKAQRAGEDIQSVKALTSVQISFPGAYKGPWINSEILAAGVVAFVAYVAFSTRTKLLA